MKHLQIIKNQNVFAGRSWTRRGAPGSSWKLFAQLSTKGGSSSRPRCLGFLWMSAAATAAGLFHSTVRYNRNACAAINSSICVVFSPFQRRGGQAVSVWTHGSWRQASGWRWQAGRVSHTKPVSVQHSATLTFSCHTTAELQKWSDKYKTASTTFQHWHPKGASLRCFSSSHRPTFYSFGPIALAERPLQDKALQYMQVTTMMWCQRTVLKGSCRIEFAWKVQVHFLYFETALVWQKFSFAFMMLQYVIHYIHESVENGCLMDVLHVVLCLHQSLRRSGFNQVICTE